MHALLDPGGRPWTRGHGSKDITKASYFWKLRAGLLTVFAIQTYIFSWIWRNAQVCTTRYRGSGLERRHFLIKTANEHERMSVNTKMEHRTLAWALVITGTRVHLSESVSRKDFERKMFLVQAAFLPSVEVENNICNFRWRPSPYPFPNPIFTLLKIPYLNRNHRH